MKQKAKGILCGIPKRFCEIMMENVRGRWRAKSSGGLCAVLPIYISGRRTENGKGAAMGRQQKMVLAFAIVIGVLLIVLMAKVTGALPTTSGDGRRLDSGAETQRYPYQQLNTKEQQLYTALYDGISAHQGTIVLPGVYREEEYKKVYLLLMMQEPQFFYVDTQYMLAEHMAETNICYRYDAETAAKMTKELDAAADRILEQVSYTQTEWQKLRTIHDGIAAGCTYEIGARSDDAYGCLVDGIAQCEGYAKAFLYVTRRAELETMCVTGKSERGVLHVWNMVQIDGNYYHVDVTWDDDPQYAGEVSHRYFAVPDDWLTDHIADTEPFAPPKSKGTGESYYYNQGYVLQTASQLGANVRNWISVQLVGGTGLAEFYCASPEVYAAALNEICNGTLLNDWAKESGVQNRTVRVIPDERQMVIGILVQ